MARNIFASPFDGLQQGFETAEGIADTIRRKRASYRAAPKIAQGDYGGAAQEYGAMGFDQEAASARGAQEQANAQGAAEAERKGQLLIKAAQALTTVPMGQRKQALSHPLFSAIGLTPEMVDGLTEENLSDDQLRMFVGEVKRNLELVKASDGSYSIVDMDRGGMRIGGYEPPTPDKYEQVDPEKDLVRIPGREGGVSGFDAVIDPLLEREGGFVARDGRSNAPANFGINQRFNPDVDVSKLTPEQAKSIYRERYWNAIDGDNLPPEAQAAVFDAAVNQGPERARQWWQQSGGDLAKFNEFRLQHYRSRPDYEKYGKGWERRVAETGGVEVVRKGQPKPKEQWVDLPGGGQRNTVTGKTEGVPKASGRLSATVVKMQNDLLQDLQAASSVNTIIDRSINQIDSGELDLGLAKNIFAQGQNALGVSSESSRNFASFRAALEKMRNDSLRLNKGVQTEGDAQRAWNELITNLNDPRLVRQRLEEIKDLNEQAIALRQDLVNQARQDSGLTPLDTSRFRARPAKNDPGPSRGGIRTVNTPEEAAALPPGTKFRTPDGQVRVRR